MKSLPLLISVGVVLCLVVASALALAGFRKAAEPAQAVHAGGVDNMSIDMDPATSPANTSTSIGTIENCAVINENDIKDADEDAVDALELDVVVGPLGVPAGNPMTFYAYTLGYSAANLRVTAQNQGFLLHESGGGFVTVSDVTPDSDGEFNAGELDLDLAAAETGPGVLSRVTIESLETATPGVYLLTLTHAVTSDTTMDPTFPADTVNNAIVVIGPPPVPNPCGDDDGDGLVNVQDNCPTVATSWFAPAGDDDCDGWSSGDEGFIGTDGNIACGTGAWPPDFNDSSSVDVFDVNFLKPAFFSTAPGPPYDVRLDLLPDSSIDIFDVNMIKPVFFLSCTP